MIRWVGRHLRIQNKINISETLKQTLEAKNKEIPMEIPKRHNLKINPTRILGQGVGGLNVTVKWFLQPIVAFCNNL